MCLCVHVCENVMHKRVHLYRAAINVVECGVRFMLGGSRLVCWMFIESSLSLRSKETNQLEQMIR